MCWAFHVRSPYSPSPVGDGLSNTIIPTSGILMAMLGLSGIPYDKWLKFMIPLFLRLSALAIVFLSLAVALDL